MSRSYLGFDLGASSGRAVVGSLVDGRLEMREVHRFRTPVTEANGHLYWDLEALWNEVSVGIAKAREEAPGLCSVSVDSWALDYVPLDTDDRPLRDPYCYRDPRTRGLLPEMFDRVPAAELYARTGIQMMEINTSVQMVAEVDEEPAGVRRTNTRLFVADYLNYMMSGRAVAERSMASTTQLMSISTGEWDIDLMRRLGIPADQWPEIVSPGTRLGCLQMTPNGAAHFADGTDTKNSANSDIAVIAGCSHDTAAAIAAVPADENGPAWAYICSGTWSLLGAECTEPVVTEEARAANFTNEAGLDGSIRFLKNLTGFWVQQECERVWRANGEKFSYSELMDEALNSPSTGCFVDLGDPRFATRGAMVSKLHDYCAEYDIPAPATRGAAIRLILESLAASYARTLETLEELLGRRIEVVHIVGGGARNTLMCQWTADACGRSVLAGPAEATVAGNLLVQARTLGDLPAGQSIRQIVRASCPLGVYEPSTDTAESLTAFK